MDDAYPLCTNCAQEILDPTNLNEETLWTHLHTLTVQCHPDDLAEQGLLDEGYVATPVTPNDDGEGGSRTGEQYLADRGY